ncbi:MAG: hypothetical protein ACRDRP_11510 [Pseudonocardiaceae bacterium]
MTARRRRKTGSGPAATALIAWVGGAQVVADAPAGAVLSGVHAWSPGRSPGGRAILVGRACGLAAGTVLACGSVLASAVSVDDGSLAGEGALLPSYAPAGPGAGAGSDGSGGQAPAPRAVVAPDAVRAQALAGTGSVPRQRSGRVHRNKPVSLDGPAAGHGSPPPTAQRPWGSPPAASGPIAPVKPVLDPTASGVERIAPVGGVLAPTARREQPRPSIVAAVPPGTPAVAPLVDKVTQPAMAMLSTLLPIT